MLSLRDPRAPYLVYVDESGMDERDEYGYGYAPVGERVYGLKSGRRQGLVNMITSYRNGEVIAPFTIEGSCNRSVFEIWLETCLIPLLHLGDLVMLDNATFHHGGRIAELIEAKGAKLVYLPNLCGYCYIQALTQWLECCVPAGCPQDNRTARLGAPRSKAIEKSSRSIGFESCRG